MASEIFPTSPKYFQIQLQNDSFHSYVAGQTVIGRVVVELKDKLKITALKIELIGKGVVHWEKEHYSVDNANRSRWRRSSPVNILTRPNIPEEETYIYQEKYLIGERAESPVTLPPGIHSFPYFFTLSPFLPTSFEGRHCHIRYFLHATLERAVFKDVKSDPLKFDIKGVLDLNQYPETEVPVNVSEHKYRDFMCWKLWSVALNLQVEKTGYAPEETLKFSVKFNNSCSNVKLTNIRAYLIQKVTVRAVRSVQAEAAYETKIMKLDGPIIEAGQIETWNGELEIPYVEPSGLGAYPSQILRFNIQYYLKVTAKNVFTTLSRQVALTIGTIPFGMAEDPIMNGGCSHANSIYHAVAYSRGHKPYNNLSEIFPPIVVNNNINSECSNGLTNSNVANNAIAATQENVNNNINDPGVDTTSGSDTPTITQFSDQSNTGTTSSVNTLIENAKAPLGRMDTPPPSYEEAIKKPSIRRRE